MKLVKVICLTIVLCIISGCSSNNTKTTFEYKPNKSGVWDLNSSPLNGAPISEAKAVYAADKAEELIPLFLTIKKGKDNNNKPKYTFDMLNSFVGGYDSPNVEVIMKEGVEGKGSLPGLFGYGEMTANGKMELKGNSKSIRQRSYKISLFDRAGPWRGSKVLNLMKDLKDLSRIKRKLAADLLEPINDITGFRTSFIHLYVKDTTSENPDSDYKDFGLYTYVEQPNKNYFKSRVLDADCNLYKANKFDFSLNESIKDVTDKDYVAENFEKFLEIRMGKEHFKLITMLEAVNNDQTNINDITSKYFNRENVLTYSAISIMLGNTECVMDNYFLYSPKNSVTFYFLPTDFDEIFNKGIGQNKEAIPDDFVGLPLFFENVFFRRFYSEPNNIQALSKKMEELSKQINPEKVKMLSDKYKSTVLKLIFSMPDLANLPKPAENVEPYIDEFPDILKNNIKLYNNNLKKPFPPYIKSFELKNQALKLNWQGFGEVMYNLEIATDPNFKNIITSKQGIKEHEIVINELTEDEYFVRITAQDKNGTTQICSNIYEDDYENKYFGVIKVN